MNDLNLFLQKGTISPLVPTVSVGIHTDLFGALFCGSWERAIMALDKESEAISAKIQELL